MHPLYEETTSLDQRCYDTFGLTPEILMEHAGLALANAVEKKLTSKKKALFICGMGNNGADGIVAARLLHGKYSVSLYLPFPLKSPLAQKQLERAKSLGVPTVSTLTDADIYVDALFGAGLTRPLDLFTCKIIETINAKNGYKIACDLPSGLLSDLSLSKAIFKADETITMGALKLSLYNDSLKDYVGKIRVAPLGMNRKLYQTPSKSFVLQKKDLRLPFRHTQNSNKGTYGHVAILEGSKEGASHLASMGAFHFGAGLVSIVGEAKQRKIYVMKSDGIPHNANVIVAGMGLETPFDEAKIRNYLLENEIPLVIDASLLHHPLMLEIIHANKPIVLTPHPKEFSTLLEHTLGQKISTETIQQNRFLHVKMFTNAFPHSVLLLKGANTIIAHHNELFINPHGSPALAKGGSGDVLAGMIGALIAQGYTPKDAAIHASLAHALSAKKIKCHNYALTPIDICKGLKWL